MGAGTNERVVGCIREALGDAKATSVSNGVRARIFAWHPQEQLYAGSLAVDRVMGLEKPVIELASWPTGDCMACDRDRP